MELTIESIRDFILGKGGKVTNYELVTAFQRFLKDPLYQAESRLYFRDAVDILANVTTEEGVKYIALKEEYLNDSCFNKYVLQDNTSQEEYQKIPGEYEIQRENLQCVLELEEQDQEYEDLEPVLELEKQDEEHEDLEPVPQLEEQNQKYEDLEPISELEEHNQEYEDLEPIPELEKKYQEDKDEPDLDEKDVQYEGYMQEENYQNSVEAHQDQNSNPKYQDIPFEPHNQEFLKKKNEDISHQNLKHLEEEIKEDQNAKPKCQDVPTKLHNQEELPKSKNEDISHYQKFKNSEEKVQECIVENQNALSGHQDPECVPEQQEYWRYRHLTPRPQSIIFCNKKITYISNALPVPCIALTDTEGKVSDITSEDLATNYESTIFKKCKKRATSVPSIEKPTSETKTESNRIIYNENFCIPTIRKRSMSDTTNSATGKPIALSKSKSTSDLSEITEQKRKGSHEFFFHSKTRVEFTSDQFSELRGSKLPETCKDVSQKIKTLNKKPEETTNQGIVRKQAESINKQISDFKTSKSTHEWNKTVSKPQMEKSEEDTSSEMELKKRKEWCLAAAKGDYLSLLNLLKEEPRLADTKDIIMGYTALHWAAKLGDEKLVKLLAGTHKANPNSKTHGGYTPLHLAAMTKHESIMELLISTYKANPKLRDNSGKMPFQYLQKPKTPAQRTLVQVPTKPEIRHSPTPLRSPSSFLYAVHRSFSFRPPQNSSSSSSSHKKSRTLPQNVKCV